MNLDLNTILEGWPHEPGQLRARKVQGIDGREKIQLRLDLGLIQMECEGRPDGLEPHGFTSLLDWHMARARSAEKKGQQYTITGDDCGYLHQEGIQFYHRYLAFFQLEDYPAALRDTKHNLDLFSFVNRHAEHEEMAWSFEQFRPYVMMMHTRARASLALQREGLDVALRYVEEGRDAIAELFAKQPDGPESCSEVDFLNDWMEELKSKRPLSKEERLQREMEAAVSAEAYERAAELRDAIRALQAPLPPPKRRRKKVE